MIALMFFGMQYCYWLTLEDLRTLQRSHIVHLEDASTTAEVD